MLVSIIIPIYNNDKYLEKCLDSVLQQKYDSMEIILVDDGSTDDSLLICKEYAKNDKRIKVIENPHMGSIEARRSGMLAATGQYCMFVDSDDWIADDLLSSLSAYIEDGSFDIIHYNMVSVNGDLETPWTYTIKDGVYDGNELQVIYSKMMFDFKVGNPGIIQSLATKLIKRELLEDVMQNLDGRITLGDDAAVVYPAMLKSNKIFITNRVYYYYRRNMQSLCHVRDLDRLKKIYFFKMYMQKIYENYDIKYDLKRQLQAYLIHFIEIGLRDLLDINMHEVYRVPVKIEPSTKVILYASGKVGQAYYRELTDLKVNVVAWIDKNAYDQVIFNQRIAKPEEVRSIEFDLLLIAVKNQAVANNIKLELEKNFQIPSNKIYWGPPNSDWRERIFDI